MQYRVAQDRDTLQWHHDERYGVLNHQPHDCLLNRLFSRRSEKSPKLPVTGLCEGNSPVTGEFPTQRASNAENVSIWWRNHDLETSVFWAHLEEHQDTIHSKCTSGIAQTSPAYLNPSLQMWRVVNTLRPRQNGRHFADDIFKCIFLESKCKNFD